MPKPLLLALVTLPCASTVACVMDNPAFDVRDEIADGSSTGDGDGDPSTGDGDGDGDPSTGDGDGDPSTTGDGDGDAESSTGDGDGDGDACPEGYDDCDGQCVDFQFDNANCGGCGNVCPETHLCSRTDCSPKKHVFVSKPGGGGWEGIQGADALCAEQAANAGLDGEYKAWLSDYTQSPATQFSKVGVYTLVGGPVIAWSWEDLTDGQLLAPINENEYGGAIEKTSACGLEYAVWTGTAYDGSALDPACGGWTTSLAGVTGRVGNAAVTDTGWSGSDCTAPCNTELGLYCVQQ